jgi:hypothetical protein
MSNTLSATAASEQTAPKNLKKYEIELGQAG